MLLPALNSAREQAKKASCINNLKQFGVGIAMYADMFADMIPYSTYCDPTVSSKPQFSYRPFLDAKGNFECDNLGRLYGPPPSGVTGGTGLITAAKVYFCPSENNPTYKLPLGGFGKGSNASYQYRGGLFATKKTKTSTENNWKLNSYRKRVSMASDIFSISTVNAHKREGYSVLFSDDSVIFIKQRFYDGLMDSNAYNNGVLFWNLFDQ